MNLFRHHLIAALFLVHVSGMPAPMAPAASPAAVRTEKPAPRTEDREYIPWLDERRLSWEDFQGEPKRNTDAVASTSTSLGLAYQVKEARLTYQVTCKFNKIKSWGSLKTDYILAHEQGHFDITEIFARRLHQELEDYTFNRKTFRQDVNEIYQRVVKEKEALQAAYDGETDHSRNRRQQNIWLERIQSMLDETYDFATYP